MAEEKLKGQVYKTIYDLREKLDSLGVKLPKDYGSNLPYVKSTIEDTDIEDITTRGYTGAYDPSKNIIYVDPNNEDLENVIAEESMHFLDSLTRGEVGRDPGEVINRINRHEYIKEFVGGAVRLFKGTSKDVTISEKGVRERSEELRKEKEKVLPFSGKLEYVAYIYNFLFDTMTGERPPEELVEEYENNNDFFKKYLGKKEYQQIKKLIEIPEDARSDKYKQKLDIFLVLIDKVAKLETKYERADLQALSFDIERFHLLSHKRGYDLAQKVYETDGGFEEFFKKYPEFLSEPYEQNEKDIKSFLSA